MNIQLVQAIVKGIVPEIRRHVDEQLTSLRAEIAELKSKNAELKSTLATLSGVADGLTKNVADIEARPLPTNGKDAEPVDLEAVVQLAMSRIPVPKDGTSVTVDAVAPMLETLVAALPVPKDGRDGIDGTGIDAVLIDQEGGLVLSMTDGSQRAVGRVVGKDADSMAIAAQVLASIPVPKDGRDGIGTRDEIATAVRDSVASEVPTEVAKQLTIAVDALPKMEYRGVYRDGELYDKGNMATYAGSLFVCKVDRTVERPGTGDEWQLAAKRGRDGRDKT